MGCSVTVKHEMLVYVAFDLNQGLLPRLDEKLRKLDAQLVQHREAIRKARPGPAQDAAKRRALSVSVHP